MDYYPIHTERIRYEYYKALVEKHFYNQNNCGRFMVDSNGIFVRHEPVNINIPGYFHVPYNVMYEFFSGNEFSDKCLNIRCDNTYMQNVITAINYLFQNRGNERKYKRKCIQLICDDPRVINPLKVLITKMEAYAEDFNSYSPYCRVEYNDIHLLCNSYTISEEIITVY
jgi:hypothetical protein